MGTENNYILFEKIYPKVALIALYVDLNFKIIICITNITFILVIVILIFFFFFCRMVVNCGTVNKQIKQKIKMAEKKVIFGTKSCSFE